MNKVKDIWEDFAAKDAYFAVSTFDKFRDSHLDADARHEFFESGRQHVDELWNELENLFGSSLKPRRALDYGCGVGRVLTAMAEKCEAVVGVDISSGMLAETRKNCAELGVANFELLDAVEFWDADSQSYDLVHSYIVIQHIEPKIGYQLMRKIVERLAAGGVGMLHITHFDPTPHWKKIRYRIYRDIPFVHRFLNLIRGKSESILPIYEYDRSVVYQILDEENCRERFTQPTDHGLIGEMIFFRKDEGT